MDIEKQILIAKGTIKHIPGVRKLLPPPRTGGTNESRYCYSIWMRHLRHWSMFRNGIPRIVAELGPGDSLGTGLAALLSGAEHLYALDAIRYWDSKRNLQIFDELVSMFRNKAIIPDNTVYPRVKPKLENYEFPSDILPDSLLTESLNESRLQAIRKELGDTDNLSNRFISCKIPWHDAAVIDHNMVDFIYSQAVLECIDDLENTFLAMCWWLKPGGIMSHTIDLKSHGFTKEWNGHWMFNEKEWEIVKGGKSFLLNRQPLSSYLAFHVKYGFEILLDQRVKTESGVSPEKLSKEFRSLSHEDRTTTGLYILSKKTSKCIAV